jgi:uncharacterized repeat protein (TIGR03803 family)
LNVSATGDLFKVSRAADGSWQKTSLHFFSFFSNPSNGYDPNGVIVDAAGNLYGTTVYGGDMPACSDGFSDTGCGAVYKLSPDSTGAWKEP